MQSDIVFLKVRAEKMKLAQHVIIRTSQLQLASIQSTRDELQEASEIIAKGHYEQIQE
ncbi:hypothetical protein TRAPUB_12039 [Trametes pubescens]|uniref:Uncharacterized protein n=1 Tax=Trametes pubescens TaxID=154538 RepID=A0A1M2VV53_TRAPU|nr:hypothetical protein TRAPUB_12039 [Trametes pubescens]